MSTNKITSKSNSPNPLEKMKAIHKKKLKSVIYKNKYFPNNCLEKKTQLIRKILTDERKSLDICEEIDSEEENTIADQIRSDLLDKERSNIYCYNEVPVVEPRPRSSEKEQAKNIPSITKPHLREFFKLLETKKTLDSKEKTLKNCLDHMHTSAKPLWTSPSTIMKAVNDCILTRNWNNLTELVLLMIHLPSERYKPLIRHLCQMMDKLHPVIEENDLQGQLTLVQKAVRRKQ